MHTTSKQKFEAPILAVPLNSSCSSLDACVFSDYQFEKQFAIMDDGTIFYEFDRVLKFTVSQSTDSDTLTLFRLTLTNNQFEKYKVSQHFKLEDMQELVNN